MRFVITSPSGTVVTPNAEPAGLALRIAGDPSVGRVPGGMQRLRSPGGLGSWQLMVPQTVIDALPVALRAQVVTGRPTRLLPDAFEDLLVFVVY
jgi:hypothetical protein